MSNLDSQSHLKKIHFRSWHRGTKETDIILGTFADEYLGGFNNQELKQFEEILTYEDIDLYQWVSGKKEVPEKMMNDVLKALINHANRCRKDREQ